MLNEGYIYLEQVPWINVCVTLVDRCFYFSIAFKTHSGRFSVNGKAWGKEWKLEAGS